MLRTLARGCGSSAWVAAVHGEHNWVVGNFSEQAQRDVWGKNPHAVASASFAPSGSAEPVAGGHRLSGRWGFASGCDHAQWVLLGSMAKTGGAPGESRVGSAPCSRVMRTFRSDSSAMKCVMPALLKVTPGRSSAIGGSSDVQAAAEAHGTIGAGNVGHDETHKLPSFPTPSCATRG